MKLALVLLALSTTVAMATTEAGFIRAGRRVSVHAIDSTLTPARLDDWIKALAGKGACVSWEANDCGEATGNPADSARVLPVCVEASARCADGREIRVAIAVGAGERLSHDQPDLMWAMIDSAAVTHDYASLRALARAVRRTP